MRGISRAGTDANVGHERTGWAPPRCVSARLLEMRRGSGSSSAGHDTDVEPGRIAGELLHDPCAGARRRLGQAIDRLDDLRPRRGRVPARVAIDFGLEGCVAAQLGPDLEPEERARQLAVELVGEVLGLVVGVRPEPFALVGAELPDPPVLEHREHAEQERHGGDGELGAGRTAEREGIGT